MTHMFWIHRSIDPPTRQGLYAAFHSLLDEGDEAVLMEPAFDIYSAQIKMAGGKCVYVPLRPPDASSKSWHLDWDELERAFTDKTRLVVLNTPHNPTGKASPCLCRRLRLCVQSHAGLR